MLSHINSLPETQGLGYPAHVPLWIVDSFISKISLVVNDLIRFSVLYICVRTGEL